VLASSLRVPRPQHRYKVFEGRHEGDNHWHGVDVTCCRSYSLDMPFAPERPEQIRAILCAEYVSQSLESEESKPDKASHGKANSSARHQRSGADTGGDGERSTREIDRRLRFLKRLHGGFPIFDDARPGGSCSLSCVHSTGPTSSADKQLLVSL